MHTIQHKILKCLICLQKEDISIQADILSYIISSLWELFTLQEIIVHDCVKKRKSAVTY